MITREQMEIAFGDEKRPFQTKNIDHTMTALQLLRERIPYDECHEVLVAAEHDIIYLCSVDVALQFISEVDLKILADCNMMIDDDDDCLALFV